MATQTSLTISSRGYMYIRSMSIQNVADALVELITNADDAYMSKTEAWTSRGDDGDIEIEFHAPAKVLVRDHAIGMNATQMKANLLNVGDYTAVGNLARGHFSRGAKDISALGNVTFQMVKNGLYSACRINYDTTVEVLAEDVEYTDALKVCGLQKDGLVASIDVRPEFIKNTPVEMFDLLLNRVSLRCINTDPHMNVQVRCFTEQGIKWVQRRIFYQYPVSDPLLDIEFNVPNYPGATAKMTLRKSKDVIPESIEVKGRGYGVVIASSDRINHDVTIFNPVFESEEAVRYIFGRLECPYIKDLMIDFDSNGISPKNPFTVLDPSRQTGVNVDHPFIKELYSVARVHFEFYVFGVQDDLDKNVVQSKDINDLMQNLEQFGTQLISSDEHIKTWRATRDAPYIRTLNDVRTNFVTAESREIVLERPSYHHSPTKAVQLSVDRMEKIYDTTKPSQGLSTRIIENGSFVEGEQQDADYIARVYENKLKFQIEYSKMTNPTYKFSIVKKDANIKLRIFLNDPYIAKYIQFDEQGESVTNLDDPKVVQLIGNIVIEALSRLLLESEHSINKDKFISMNDAQVIGNIMRNFEKKVVSIQMPVQATIDNFLTTLTTQGTSDLPV